MAKPKNFDNYVLYKQEKDIYGNEPTAGYTNRYRLERFSKNDFKIIGKPNEGPNGVVAFSKDMGKQCEYMFCSELFCYNDKTLKLTDW